MRRENFELFKKNTKIGLLQDCAYFAWQNHQITDEELFLIDVYCQKVYERNWNL